MSNIILLPFAFFVVATVAIPTPKYVINLDISPEARWAAVAKDFKSLSPEIHELVEDYVPQELLPLFEKVTSQIDDILPEPYSQEIRGLAKGMNASLGDLVALHILYDLTAFCTSIVAQDQTNKIWHGRNLDYGHKHFTSLLRELVIDVEFQIRGKLVYKGPSFAGYTGLLTGVRPNAFTVSLNERDQGYFLENALIFLLDRKAPLTGFLIRQTLEEQYSFETAVKRLSDTVTIAGGYYTVGGVEPGEGVIITKDRLAAVDLYYLEPLNSRWYLLETNYDHWTTPPPSDDRRDPGIKLMNSIGRAGINNDTLFKVLSTEPILNNKTIFTSLMSAGQMDTYKIHIRTKP